MKYTNNENYDSEIKQNRKLLIRKIIGYMIAISPALAALGLIAYFAGVRLFLVLVGSFFIGCILCILIIMVIDLGLKIANK